MEPSALASELRSEDGRKSLMSLYEGLISEKGHQCVEMCEKLVTALEEDHGIKEQADSLDELRIQALDLAEALLDLSWEKLHTGYWSDVPEVWRDCYALACLFKTSLNIRCISIAAEGHHQDVQPASIEGQPGDINTVSQQPCAGQPDNAGTVSQQPCAGQPDNAGTVSQQPCAGQPDNAGTVSQQPHHSISHAGHPLPASLSRKRQRCLGGDERERAGTEATQDREVREREASNPRSETAVVSEALRQLDLGIMMGAPAFEASG
ncbi:hypothetical protein CEUSTIGMA_g13796.t1 [Chlamydomonas eustigma]|uniref:DM8 domain-containing protein n=1 Tax=Chlamydomonas eustigma TaxID=1157962 RepID=A0A250XTI8_9CHLO|nr:hypothetical protein CEUSTIGMA_g13796.t1 [Chlamydomonas eustigma]|eukprot:GAX86384.1 hypothetical protein CEUSTIGMA_g13796.t1 [Chlamydomonas eustigma]